MVNQAYRACPTCGKPDERYPRPSIEQLIKNCRMPNATRNELDAADYLEQYLGAKALGHKSS